MKSYLAFDDYLDSPEWKIRADASEMLSYFLEIGKEPPNFREWKSSFKKRLDRLYKDCEVNNIHPVPEELKELERQLSTRKKDVYPVEKHFVASWLAWNFDPEDLKTKRNQIIREGNAALNDLHGLRQNMKDFKASRKNEYEQTIKRLIEDEQFLQEWQKKRTRYQTLKQRVDIDSALVAAKTAIK